VVDSIVDRSNNQSEFANIMANCRVLLQYYPNFKINFAWRQANSVAHSLARVSKLYARHQVFDTRAKLWATELACLHAKFIL